MRVWPVIKRELRAQARQPFTFNLRMLGAAALLALLAGVSVLSGGRALAPNQGGWLFDFLHTALFWLIWILVPLSAADCISRERREGTLGLLFLTPLKSTDIVVAKGLVHGLRAATLLVAVLPVMTIPFLMGGLSWQQAAMSAMTNFSSVCWALAAALVASSRNRSGLRAMVAAAVFASGALLVFAFVIGILLRQMSARGPVWTQTSSDYTWLLGLGIAGAGPRNWQAYSTMFAPAQMLRGMAQTAVVSLVALIGAVLLAAFQIRRAWREEPPAGWVRWLEEKLCTPVLWLGFFRRWMRWKLERNPLGWLEQRRWTGRLVTWSWLAVVMSIYIAAFSDASFERLFFRSFAGLQMFLGWLMLGSIASSAAGSFRHERETGLLELLLVAPLTTDQIIGGRLRGLWGQFLPVVALFLGVWLYFIRLVDPERRIMLWFFGITFLTLPVIGLFFSLRCRNFISALILTVLVGGLVPLKLPGALAILSGLVDPNLPGRLRFLDTMPATFIVQVATALVLAARLRSRLERRAFPLVRTPN